MLKKNHIEMNKDQKESYKTKRQKRKDWKEEKLLKKLKKEAAVESDKSNETKNAIEVKPLSTISIAVPGSILDNAQSPELRTYLAGQIARAACIFQIDEVIIFDDGSQTTNDRVSKFEETDGIKTSKRCCAQLGRILQYLECPQYLRKFFFPIHNDLKYAGILNPLDAPHHLRQTNTFIFREGVVTNKPTDKGSYVNVGLLQDCRVDKVLTPGLRVTVKLLPQLAGSKKIRGIVVSPSLPRTETGIYWGYTVRIANTLTEIFTKSPYKKGYDLTIGTSDKGTSVYDTTNLEYNHALIVFGGLQGIEAALENDEILNADDPKELFDHYFNTLPDQGSRTIRTEEAIIVTMAVLRTKLSPKNKFETGVVNTEA